MEEDQQNLVKDLTTEKKSAFKEIVLPALVILVIILAGSATGYLLVNRGGVSITKSSITNGPKEAGIKDEKQFPDNAEGKLQINDDTNITEGSHRLIRPGGISQTAYLTSSVVDLNQFTGKCVQVWGETFAAQKAGWLMDVGRVKLLDSCPAGI